MPRRRSGREGKRRPAKPRPTGAPPDPIGELVAALDRAGLRYVFTGALALAYWGAPRASIDIDVVVHGTDVAFASLLNALAARRPDLDPVAALRTARDGGHVGILSPLPGGGSTVIDLIRPRLGTLDRRILDRARTMPFPGPPERIPIVTPEDLIVYKLIFFRRDEKHDDLRDIESILARQTTLDVQYLLATVSSLYDVREERVAWIKGALDRHGRAPPPPVR